MSQQATTALVSLHGFSVFRFPKSPHLRKFVKNKFDEQPSTLGDGWEEHNGVCSCHFEETVLRKSRNCFKGLDSAAREKAIV